MVDINDPSSAPNVNEEFLSQNQTIGGTINPGAFRPEAIVMPKINPAPMQGNPGAIPNSNKPQQAPITKTKDFADALFNHMKQAPDYAKDETKYGKTWAYDADYSGIFYKRYADQANVYKKLGFSPWKDNETAYNKESSWLDNFKRSFSSAGTLAGLSFSGSLPWNAYSGTGDIGDAKIQERAFAEGSDTRGGAGAWLNNQVLNSGFSVGVIGEFAAEEAVMWAGSTLLAPESLGATWGAAAIQTGRKVEQVKNAFKVAEMAKSIGKGLNYVKDLDWARDFYKGIVSGKTLAKVGKAVSPHTLDYFTEMGRLSKAGTELNGLVKTSRGVGAFYKDVRGIAAVLSESKMEAASVELQLRDKLIDDYYQQNGKMPSTQDYADIYATAKDGAVATYWWNVPGIYLSNKIVFEKMLTGFKPLAQTREALSQGFKNYAIKEETAGVYKPIKTGLRQDFKSLLSRETWKPANLTKNFLGKMAKYSTANIAEGLQEQYQEGISGAMKEYYADRYEHPSLAGSRSAWGYLGENMAKQVTTQQGWETFGSGFFMGGLLQFPQHMVMKTAGKIQEAWKGQEGAQKARDAEEQRVNQTVNSLNAASTFLGQYMDPKQESTAVALRNTEDLEKAARNGDKYAHLNIVDDTLNDHFYTLAQTGKIELIEDQIKDYLKMTPKEMEEAWGVNGKTTEESGANHTKKLNQLLELSSTISERHKNIDELYGNPFNEWRYNPKTQSTEFVLEKINRTSFDKAKKMAVMSSMSYDQTATRIKSLIDKAATAKPVAKANASDFQVLYSAGQLEKEIWDLQNEVDVYSANAKNNPQDVKTLKDKKERLRLLSEFQDENNAFKSAMEAHEANLSDPNSEVAKKAKAMSAARKGATVKYTAKGKAAKSFVIDKVVGEWAYDKEGKRYKRKNLEVTKAAKSEFHEDDFMEEAAMKLHESYSNYVKHIAKVNDTHAFDSNITDSFKDYMDFLRLSNDQQGLADAVNWLNNPRSLTDYANRLSEMTRAEGETRLQKLKDALKAYEKKMGVNTLLNELYKIGVYMDEADMKAFTENHVVSKFYYVTEGHALVNPKSEKYKEAIKLIEDWERTHNEQYRKPIENVQTHPEDAGFNAKGRSKINNDVRTYNEQGAYWGFDPTVGETYVNSRDVIQKIIDSPYATYEEKLLARKILSAISADSRVRFNREGRPGYFAYTADTKTGVTIDARFFSHDFNNGGTPIEAVLLHEFLHELTSQEMENNPTFKAEIAKLLEIARAEFKKNPTKAKPFYGIKNEHEFIAEVMSNGVFRTFLQGIKFEGARKSLWTDFVDSLKRMLSAVLGVSQDSSLLDEALYVITSKIDEFYGETKAPEKGTGLPTGGNMGKLHPGSSLAQFQSAGLIPILVETFKNFVDFNKANGSTVYDHLALNGMADGAIMAMPEFKEFLGLGTPPVIAVLDRHNGVPAQAVVNPVTPSDWPTLIANATSGVELNKIVQQMDAAGATTPDLLDAVNVKRETVPEGAGQTSLPLTIGEKRRLNDPEFGYTYPEINRMTPEEGRRILSENVTKSVAQQQTDEARQARVRSIQDQRNAIAEEMKNKINNVEHFFEFDALENEIAMDSVADPEGVDVDWLMTLIDQKKAELANPTYDRIQERETVIMMNGFKKIVVTKSNGIITLRNFGQDDGRREIVRENEVAEKIKYRFEPGMEEVIVTPPISPENQQASNESITNAIDETTDDQINTIAATVANRTEEDLENDLDDDSGCGS
jgi:hypothetical protein